MDLLKHQQDLEDALRLDASDEDLKTNKDARLAARVVKTQRKHIKKFGKIPNKNRDYIIDIKLYASVVLLVLIHCVPWLLIFWLHA